MKRVSKCKKMTQQPFIIKNKPTVNPGV